MEDAPGTMEQPTIGADATHVHQLEPPAAEVEDASLESSSVLAPAHGTEPVPERMVPPAAEAGVILPKAAEGSEQEDISRMSTLSLSPGVMETLAAGALFWKHRFDLTGGQLCKISAYQSAQDTRLQGLGLSSSFCWS